MERIGKCGWLVLNSLYTGMADLFNEIMQMEEIGFHPNRPGFIHFVTDYEIPENHMKRIVGIAGVICDTKKYRLKPHERVKPSSVKWLCEKAFKGEGAISDVSLWILLQLINHCCSYGHIRLHKMGATDRFKCVNREVIRFPDDRVAYWFYRQWFKLASNVDDDYLISDGSFMACLRVPVRMADTVVSKRLFQNVVGVRSTQLERVLNHLYDEKYEFLRMVERVLMQHRGHCGGPMHDYVRLYWPRKDKRFRERTMAFELFCLCIQSEKVPETLTQLLILQAMPFHPRGVQPKYEKCSMLQMTMQAISEI